METRDYLWPTEDQLLLLRAALSEREEARAAYSAWCGAVDLAGPVDHGSMGLLPLVHANLDMRSADLPHSGLIAGVRRRSFVEVQRAIGGAGEVLALLADANIPAMVIKGVPLALDYYAHPGLRPMADADVLVERQHAERALDTLADAGWQSDLPDWVERRDRYLTLRHAVELSRGAGAIVDLHWRPVHEPLPADAERRLWSCAAPITVGGAATLRPDATSMLMHVLLHGLRRNQKAPLRWIPDALAVLARERTSIEWDWLVATGRRARMFNRLGLGLRFLHDNFAAAIPPEVLLQIDRSQPSLVERLENQLILGKRRGAIALNSYRAAMLLRLPAGSAPFVAVVDFLRRNAVRRRESTHCAR